jgi:hypothetical protein
MLTETLLKIPYSVIGHWLVRGGFRYDCTESQAASCIHFQCQNRRFRVFEAGYWKNFQNWSVSSKKQAKTLSSIVSQTKKPKILKLSAHIQQVPIYYSTPSKQCSSRDTIPLLNTFNENFICSET